MVDIPRVGDISEPVDAERRAWREDGESFDAGMMVHILSAWFHVFLIAKSPEECCDNPE